MTLRKREDMRGREGTDVLRTARRKAASMLYTALVLAAVVVVVAMSMGGVRHSWDASVVGGNTLSPMTLKILAKLDEPVRVYAFFTHNHRSREGYWYLLQRYRMANNKVHVEFIDPVVHPGALKDLGLSEAEQRAGRDAFTVIFRGSRHLMFRGIKEEDVTNAILEVASGRRKVAGFLQGFGERDLTSNRPTGYSRLVEVLAQEYFDTRGVTLAEEIPADVTLVVAAGPILPIPQERLRILRNWLDSGGRLLVLLDPGQKSGFDTVLEPFGLRSLKGHILDPRDNYNRNPAIIRVTRYTQHVIVRDFGPNFPTFFPEAGPVEQFEPGDPLVFHDDLARTSDFAISETAEGIRSQGPFTVAAASWRKEPKAGAVETRIVLVGDADFASNAFLPLKANRNLLLNCVNWLSSQEERVSVRHPVLRGQILDLNAVDRRVVYASVFGAPLLVLLAGVIVYFRRRRM